MAQDNSTFVEKISLRKKLLNEIENKKVILETFAGFGELYESIYKDSTGTALEKKEDRALFLSDQRPEWFVFCCDALHGVNSGLGKSLTYNFIDIDPYGNPWEIIDSIFEPDKYKFEDKISIAVNDGMRQKLKMNGAWSVPSMDWFVKYYGNNDIYKNYKEACIERLKEVSASLGFKMKKESAYYCGAKDGMTHYAAILER